MYNICVPLECRSAGISKKFAGLIREVDAASGQKRKRIDLTLRYENVLERSNEIRFRL